MAIFRPPAEHHGFTKVWMRGDPESFTVILGDFDPLSTAVQAGRQGFYEATTIYGQPLPLSLADIVALCPYPPAVLGQIDQDAEDKEAHDRLHGDGA